MIKRKGQDWLLYTRDGSRVLGHHPSQEGARRQEAAIMARKRVGQMQAPKKMPKMKKLADVAEVAIPKGLYYEAAAGEPAAVADIKRLEEAQAKRVFGAGSRALPGMFGKAFLGRTRSPGAALTSREEKLIEQFPQLRQLSAGANPERTYRGARVLTHPGMVAIPSAGVGALTARLIAQALGAEGATKELATAGGAALGGLAGSVGAHSMRQRHARQLEQYMRAHEPTQKIGAALREATIKLAAKKLPPAQKAEMADEVLMAARILDASQPQDRKSIEKAFGQRAADIRKDRWWKLGSLYGAFPHFLDAVGGLVKTAIPARLAAEGAEGAAKAIARALGIGAEEAAPAVARQVGRSGTKIFRGVPNPILEADPALMAQGVMRTRIPAVGGLSVPSGSTLMEGLTARMATEPMAALPGVGQEAVEGAVRRALGAPVPAEMAEAAARARGLGADALSHEIALKRYMNMTRPLGLTGEATKAMTPEMVDAIRLQEAAYQRLVDRVGPAYAEMFKTSPELFTSGVSVV